MPRPKPPPFRPYSVHFAYKGSRALRLVNPRDDTFLGATPEWVEGSRNTDIAYVKGEALTVQVVFILSGGGSGSVGRRQGEQNLLEGTVRATSSWKPDAADPKTWLDVSCSPGTTLKFNRTGLSDPVEFTLEEGNRLPDTVGTWHVNWLWQWQSQSNTINLGVTDHVIYTTWRPLLSAGPWADGKAASKYSPADNELVDVWMYSPIVEWTCAWIQGTEGATENEKTFCDALMKNLPKSGLTYYQMAWAVKDMLNKGGGMCGGWYKMFQAMAAAHGIVMERRSFLVDRVDHSQDQVPDVKWDAIVVRRGGVGLPFPAEKPTTFHDAMANENAIGRASSYTERRYRFWGKANGYHADGHCVNFLKDTSTGMYTLYDPSFGDHGIDLELPELPDIDLNNSVDSWDVGTVGNFKEAYLDGNIEYMMGSLTAGGEPFEAFWDFRMSCSEPHHIASFNGVTVETRSIKDGTLPIPFFWGP